MAETQVQKLMRILNCTEEEAKQVLADDKAIDQGKRMEFDLDPETEKMAKKFANTHERKKPMVLDNKPRARKENATKGGIISELHTFLTENSGFSIENCVITNKERQIAFEIGGEKFELTLIQKRKPK